VKILEVGSGPNGIGEYIQFNFVGCDIKFDGKINSNLLPVLGSAEKLPFKDNSFDIVLSSDMLEHIENKKRTKVINELIRVSKYLTIIGCPCGKKSQNCEQLLLLWYQLIRRKYPNWLIEHLKNGLPSESEILQVIQNYHYSVLNNENVFVHMGVIILESIIGRATNSLAKLLLSSNLKFLIIELLSFGTPYRKIFIIWKRNRFYKHEQNRN
jgi:hypothetical protein